MAAWTGARYLWNVPGPLGADGQAVTGDFINFYVGGRMIWEGQGHLLYDFAAQRSVQDTLTGADYYGQHWFLNPPAFALLLAPITSLPFVPAFLVFNGCMIAALAGAFVLLKPHLRSLGGRPMLWLTTVLLAVGFHPVFRTMIGGQNTCLTLLLLAGIYAFWRSGRRAAAGIALGLLTYKPQFGPLLLVVMVLRREWRICLWAAATGLAHYTAAAWCCGWDWPVRMLTTAREYQPLERAWNFKTHVSFWSACEYSLPAGWAHAVAAVLIVGVVLVVARLALRTPAHAPQFPLLYAMITAAALLVSPHTQYYDVGLLVLPVLLGLDYALQNGRSPSVGWRCAVAAGYLFYVPGYQHAEWLGFQPLVLWPVLTLVWLVSTAAAPAPIAAPAGTDAAGLSSRGREGLA